MRNGLLFERTMNIRSSLRRLSWIALAVLVAWLGASFAFAWRITRRGKAPYVEALPTKFAGVVEELRLYTSDGEELGAWFVDASAVDAPSVILLHGLGGARSARLGAASIFRERGCATLLVTLRAHGDSTGERQDFGWSSRHDVVAAVEWLEQRRPGAKIVVSAASLGAAATVFAGGELGERVSGYELECMYRDLDTAARNRCETALPAPLGWIAFEGLRLASDMILPDHERIAPVEAIGALPHSAPILLLAGSADHSATIEEQRALFERVREHAELTVIANAPHDRLQGADPVAYRAALLAWLERTLTH